MRHACKLPLYFCARGEKRCCGVALGLSVLAPFPGHAGMGPASSSAQNRRERRARGQAVRARLGAEIPLSRAKRLPARGLSTPNSCPHAPPGGIQPWARALAPPAPRPPEPRTRPCCCPRAEAPRGGPPTYLLIQHRPLPLSFVSASAFAKYSARAGGSLLESLAFLRKQQAQGILNTQEKPWPAAQERQKG